MILTVMVKDNATDEQKCYFRNPRRIIGRIKDPLEIEDRYYVMEVKRRIRKLLEKKNLEEEMMGCDFSIIVENNEIPIGRVW